VIGNKVFSYVGKISYSVYLWHWPIHLWMEPYEWLAFP
jgi:peptidoglycan/LPS O-acetylase OafA/YrhL